MTAKLDIEDVLGLDGLADLDTNGYAVGQLQLGNVMLHVVFIRVTIDGEWLEYDGTIGGANADVDAIFNLMGDGAGHPMLLDYKDKTYLVGAMPYGR